MFVVASQPPTYVKRSCSMSKMMKNNVRDFLSHDFKSSPALSFFNSQSLPNLDSCLSNGYPFLGEVKRSQNDYKLNSSEQPIREKEHCLHPIEVPGTFSQVSEYLIEMELLVLTMISDLSKNELRLPTSSINPEKRGLLKKLAAENDLVMFSIGKGKSSIIILRKKAALLQRQSIEREILLKAANEKLVIHEQEREQLLEEHIVSPNLDERQKSSSISIQANEIEVNSPKNEFCTLTTTTSVSTSSSEHPQMNSAARRKARREAIAKEAAAAILARSRMVESTMQTCPLDHLLCPWCTMEIPPDAQCGHVEICRAGLKQRARQAKVDAQLEQHRLTVENSRRRKLGLAPIKKTANKAKNNFFSASSIKKNRQSSRSLSRSRRSRSRTHSVDSKQSVALKRQIMVAAQLENVHPNDVDGMLHASQRLCTQVGCAHLIGASGGSCPYCKMLMCPQHRQPHIGHDCKLAPLLKSAEMNSVEGKHLDTACGEDYEERQLALRLRMKEKLRTLADKRQR